MKQSMKHYCARNSIDLNSINHTLHSLCIDSHVSKKVQRQRKKRTFKEMNNGYECKDNINDLCNNIHKRMRLSISYPKTEKIETKINAKTEGNSLEIIPKSIKYASLMNENVFVTKLCRNDSPLHKLGLNKYNGALVKYVKPNNGEWKELIHKYYEKQTANAKKKQRRAIRLHTSNYGCVNQNNLRNGEDLKKMANKCYVSSVQIDTETAKYCMDCD